MVQRINVLVVNPNSSQSVTEIIRQSIPERPNVQLSFMTGPAGCPASIDNDQDGDESAKHCLPQIVTTLEQSAIDAVLVACYSEHPLVPALRQLILERNAPTHVLGIFEASILQSLALTSSGEKFGIVTTGKSWEPVLTDATLRYLGTSSSSRFAGVIGTGLGVLELGEEGDDKAQKITQAAVEMSNRGATALCLGCAGMSGLEGMVKGALKIAGRKAFVVDGVSAGIHGEFLVSMDQVFALGKATFCQQQRSDSDSWTTGQSLVQLSSCARCVEDRGYARLTLNVQRSPAVLK